MTEENTRHAGVLLPVTALPGPHPCGSLGLAARRFIDHLASAGASHWQVLPLGPTRKQDGDSPYSAACAFSLGTDLIATEDLAALLDPTAADARAPDLPTPSAGPRPLADRMRAGTENADALREFESRIPTHPDLCARFEAFVARNASWLHEAARFAAACATSDGAPWWHWAPALRDRSPAGLAALDATSATAIERYKRHQFAADELWRQTRRYANDRGVKILGDLPIYVHAHSPDVWVHREMFRVSSTSGPTHFGGVPPDAFSDVGQLWRNPTFDWEASAARGHTWWQARVERQLDLFDVLRLDHFRGFAAYWEVDATAEDARAGRWVPGPGEDLLGPLVARFGADRFFAEDLGIIDAPVDALLRALDLPGMRVLQFALDTDAPNPRHVPANWPAGCVAYTGTHDNPTSRTWLDGLDPEARARLDEILNCPDGTDDLDALLDTLFKSTAHTVIVPLADLLGLDAAGRINTPGRPHGNWTFRARPREILDAAQRHAKVASRHGRAHRRD